MSAPMAPCVIPFGHGLVMTASGIKEGMAVLVVRAVGDEYIGVDVNAAWKANEENGGPVWFLSFPDAKSLRSIAENLESMAKEMDEQPQPKIILNQEIGE